MAELDVCLCEPFILPGILPTLGVSTIKSELEQSGLKCKVIYPSITYFVQEELYKKPFILSLVEDTPLQLVEYLFVKDELENTAIDYVYSSLKNNNRIEKSEAIIDVLKELHERAVSLVDCFVDLIIATNPKVFCFSTTFGDLNFDLMIIEKLKRRKQGIKIICGGSNCDPDYSKKLMTMSKALDAVICDETGFITADYVKNIKYGTVISDENLQYITTRNHLATKLNQLNDLDDLPIPDFDDFIEVAKKLGINTKLLTLPYELARGCWWGELHPCSMCGFFGNQKKYVSKSPNKVISEISHMIEKYGVEQIRFSDLVNPKIELLEKLMPLANRHARFFWELRPDLSEKHIALLREFGLTCGQIGIESFSTQELCAINKGTIGVSNISVLRLLSEYKIEVIWNYLYGFTDDTPQWYETIISIMPCLYHLQPPSARKIWINRFSDLYNESDIEQLVPLGDNAFHEIDSQEFDFFFKAKENPEMQEVYRKLIDGISIWRDAYSKHYSLLAIPQHDGKLLIERKYGDVNDDTLLGREEAIIYAFFREPHTIEEFAGFFGEIDVKNLIQHFVDNHIMVYLDNHYLSVACFPTKYKWTKYYKQPSYAGGRLFEERNDNDDL